MKTLMRNLATFIERVPVAVFPVCSATGICQHRRGGGKKSFRGTHRTHGERQTRDAERVEFEVPRVETPKASKGGVSPPQPIRGFVRAS